MNQGPILYVEDESFIGKTIVNKLNEHGFEADLAADGEDGLARLSQKSYKLIFLDLILPTSSGFDILKKIKENPTTKHIPVVVFSNQSTDADKERAKELGAHDFRVKVNSTPNEILALTKSLLT